mmetsp:Transcript_103691/g.297871  ORF Transcript_103691/g.297871 Transcript_103691/m.297871 type:complete len:205 (+) Transcript_103691:111-725(+)
MPCCRSSCSRVARRRRRRCRHRRPRLSAPRSMVPRRSVSPMTETTTRWRPSLRTCTLPASSGSRRYRRPWNTSRLRTWGFGRLCRSSTCSTIRTTSSTSTRLLESTLVGTSHIFGRRLPSSTTCPLGRRSSRSVGQPMVQRRTSTTTRTRGSIWRRPSRSFREPTPGRSVARSCCRGRSVAAPATAPTVSCACSASGASRTKAR